MKDSYKKMTLDFENKRIFEQSTSSFKLDFDYVMIQILDFYHEKRNEFKLHLQKIFYSADV